MTSSPPYPRTGAVLASGAATALYYATPDFLPSRTTRGWAKAGIIAVALAASAPELRAAWATARERPAVDGEAPAPTTFRSLPARTKVVVLGSAAGALALAVRGVVAAERWAFRRGQARAVAGKRLPHTGRRSSTGR